MEEIEQCKICILYSSKAWIILCILSVRSHVHFIFILSSVKQFCKHYFTYFFSNLVGGTFFLNLFIFFYLIWLQDWLDKHADYEAIVDGANIGLYQQNFANGEFSIPQVVQPNSLTCLPLLKQSFYLTHCPISEFFNRAAWCCCERIIW